MIWLRVLVAFACGVNLGLLALLFVQVGRFFIPRWLMRGLMATSMLVTATIGISNLQHVHRPLTWATWSIGVGIISQAALLAGIVHWYGSTAGRRHIDAMLESSRAGRKSERTALEGRVDQLLFGLIAVLMIVLFTLLVIGVSSIATKQDQQRTHAALCTFTSDLAQRVNAGDESIKRSRAFLEANPEPVTLGITRATLVASVKAQELLVAGQKRTLASLAGLHC